MDKFVSLRGSIRKFGKDKSSDKYSAQHQESRTCSLAYFLAILHGMDTSYMYISKSGLHTGFFFSGGENVIAHVSVPSRGVWGYARTFWIVGLVRLILMQSERDWTCFLTTTIN